MNIVRLLSLMFFWTHPVLLMSQTPLPGSNILRPELDKYVGSWTSTDGVNKVVLRLKKIKYLFQNSQYTEDVILGCHKYTKSDSLVEDYLSDFTLVGQGRKGTIFLYSEPLLPDSNRITGTIVDKLKHKKQELDIEYRVSNGVEELVWNLKSPGDIILPPAESGVTLPSILIFRRL